VRIVKVPAFADSISEGDIRWEKKVGDHVAEDEVVCEIETDKTAVPVPSPAAGIIEAVLVEDGATVLAHQEIFKLRVTGEAPAKSDGGSAKKDESVAAAAAGEAANLRSPDFLKPPPPASESIQVPPSPSLPPVSPAPSAAAGPIPSAPPKPAPPPSRPMAAITPDQLKKPQPLSGATVKLPPSDPTKQISGTRSETRVKMNRMRQRIAQRLKEAQNTNAMLTTFNEIDMSNLMEMRKSYQDEFVKKHGMKFGFMSAFLKASAYALQAIPEVNAVIDGNEIVYRDYVDISVAVATPKGLVVPVLRNVEAMNFAEVEKGIAELGRKAKDGEIAVEDMDGGTFTVSNGGVFGSLFGTPIINPPQSAILGMHGIFDRPVARNGQVVIRPMMFVALTYDHRLIDGREAVTFLRKIKSSVEDCRTLLLGL
jgi:2-oxoglutarate dehydrogenase E2 component (dihydrolipoamide succinyltransferase)